MFTKAFIAAVLSLQKEISCLKDELAKLKSELAEVKAKANNNEQYSRRNSSLYCKCFKTGFWNTNQLLALSIMQELMKHKMFAKGREKIVEFI